MLNRRMDCRIRSGNDDIDDRSRDALRARVILQAVRKALPRTDGRPRKREAERRTAHPFPIAAPDEQAQPRPGMRDRTPSGAPPRFCAESCPSTRPGPRFLESPDPNGRTLSGTSAASTSRSDHAPDGTMPKPPASQSDEPCRRNRTRSVSRRHRLTSLTKSGMKRHYSNRQCAVKSFSISSNKLRGCMERILVCARPDAFHSTLKIRKMRSCGCESRFSALCESFRG